MMMSQNLDILRLALAFRLEKNCQCVPVLTPKNFKYFFPQFVLTELSLKKKWLPVFISIVLNAKIS